MQLNPNLFTQSGLDQMVGTNRGDKNTASNSQNISDHPATSQDSDLTTHPALTNEFSDISKLGGPAQLPSKQTPTKTHVQNPNSQGDITANEQDPHKLSSQTLSSSMTNPNSMMPNHDDTSSSPSSTMDPLIMGMMQTILSNAQMSQNFCNELVSSLCQNAQFMDQLRSQLLQKLMNP